MQPRDEKVLQMKLAIHREIFVGKVTFQEHLFDVWTFIRVTPMFVVCSDRKQMGDFLQE